MTFSRDDRPAGLPGGPAPDLDPRDWEEFRSIAHEVVDAGLDHVRGLRDGPVWRQLPPEIRARWRAPLAEGPTPLSEVTDDLLDNLLPYAMGNTHPRFFGWYMGGSNATGALAEFIAAIDGSNLGGGDTAAAELDQQVCRWLVAAMGFPATGSATLTSGGSMANLIGLCVARNAMAGVDVRRDGITALPQPLAFYASDESHSANQKALETLGLGARALRRIPVDRDLRIDLGALARAVAQDRAAGIRPACVIGTAGTTTSGSIDDLSALADFCAREGLWYHVDGAIGAMLRLSADHAGLVAGLERADSLAIDLHKWFQAPLASGAALIRDGERHFAAFNLHPAYLQEAPRGIGAARLLADYGLDLSRGLDALKVWMVLREKGPAAIGRIVDHQIGLARRMAAAIESSDDLELTAPVAINVVCFRHRGRPGMSEDDLRAFNTELMLRVQESGLAAPSDSEVGGRHTLRVAIVNHRCRGEDIDITLSALRQKAAEILAGA